MEELSNGGRAIIMETLEKYKKNEILMITDYEAVVKAISKIPAKSSNYNLNDEVQVSNYESIMEANKEQNLE